MSVPLRLALIGLALVGAACASTAPTPLRLPPSSPRAAPAPAPPAQIVVQRGDTLITIARRGGVETAALARANGLAPPYRLRVGQVLTLPPGRAGTAGRFAPSPGDAQSLAVPAVPAAPVEAAALPPLAPRERLPAVELDLSEEALPPISPRPDARTAGGGTAGEARAPERESPGGLAALPSSPPPPAGRGFLWPLRGQIVSEFGPKAGGLTNDGINIAAPRGTPIRAAENGVVSYVGNELKGFGNLVILRHADGWTTTYGHAEEILVERGAEIRRGQIIARVGRTGNVATPQLHFEIRRGARPVNPRGLLGPETAEAAR